MNQIQTNDVKIQIKMAIYILTGTFENKFSNAPISYWTLISALKFYYQN